MESQIPAALDRHSEPATGTTRLERSLEEILMDVLPDEDKRVIEALVREQMLRILEKGIN